MTALTHPTREQLEAFGLGLLSPRELEEVAEHIEQCEECCRTLASVQNDTVVELARQAKVSTGHTPMTDELATLGGGFGLRSDTFEIPAELVDHPRYEILDPIGRGGMGVVFKGHHRMMERVVALKVINPEYTSDPTALARFHREVRAAARLTHPNIVNAFDADHAGELHFLVMEYVDGLSLDKVIRTHGSLPIGHVCNYIVQTANGLQHAHDQGMVHRDIKPHNLMLTREGRIKILDFGLTRIIDETRQNLLRSKEKTLTQHNSVVGTPDYLAPEQARNSRDVDGRSDIYSLGCTMYHLLTGRPPFPGGSAMEKLVKHTEAQPRPVEHYRNDVPQEVSAVLKKLMAKKPADRYQTPAQVSRALEPFGKTVSVSAPKPQTPVSSQLPVNREHPKTAKVDVPVAPVTAAKEGLSVVPPRKRKSLPLWIGITIAVAALFVGVVIAVLVFGGGEKQPNENVAAKRDGNFHTKSPTNQHDNKPQPPARAEKPKVLYVLPYKDFWPKDFEPIRNYLVAKGIEVNVAANKAGWCTPSKFAKEGHKVRVEKVLTDDFDPHEYDAIVFGGWKVQDYCQGGSHFEQVGKVLDKLDKRNRIIAAICTAQHVLGDHGLLKNRRVAWCDKLTAQQLLKSTDFGAKDFGDRVVRDRNIITARDPDDGESFAKALVEALQKQRRK